MASAINSKTYDTSAITIRDVYTRNPINAFIEPLKTLITDGAGGTYWAYPSSVTLPGTLGLNSTFTSFITNFGTIGNDLSYNTVFLRGGSGIGVTATDKSTITIQSQIFNRIDVSGNNSLFGYQQNTYQSSFTLVGTGGIQITADQATNTLFFTAPKFISTPQNTYTNINIYTNISTAIGTLEPFTEFTRFSSVNLSSTLTHVGVGEFVLTRDSTNTIYFGLDQTVGSVSTAVGNYNTMSTNYLKLTDFSTGTVLLSTTMYTNTSTVLSTFNGLDATVSTNIANLPFQNYVLLTNFNAATNVLKTGISTLSSLMTSAVAYNSTFGFINNTITTINSLSSLSTLVLSNGTATDFNVKSFTWYPGDLSTLSTGVTTQINQLQAYISSVSISVNSLSSQVTVLSSFSTAITSLLLRPLTLTAYTTQSQLTSTVTSLGAIGYINQTNLNSTIRGLGTAQYVSSQSYNSSLAALGTSGYITQTALNTSLANYGTTSGFISSASLLSTMSVVNTGLINSYSSFLISAGKTTVSTITFMDTYTQVPAVMAISSGRLAINNTLVNVTQPQVQLISFISSVRFLGNNNVIVPTLDGNYSFYFSTANIYFAPFAQYIVPATTLLVDYVFNIQFDYWNFNTTGINLNANGNIVNFYTGILYNGVLDTSSIIYDTFIANAPRYQTNSNGGSVFIYQSNTLSRRVQFKLNTQAVVSNYDLPITVFHYFSSSLYAVKAPNYYSGFFTTSTIANCSPTNSVFLSVFNNSFGTTSTVTIGQNQLTDQSIAAAITKYGYHPGAVTGTGTGTGTGGK